jgi:MFS family permease
LKKKLRKLCCYDDCESRLLGVMLAIATQTSGIVAILEYSKQLFDKIDERFVAADTILLVLGFFQVVAVFLGGLLINRFGRRPIMLCGQVIIVLSLLATTILTVLVEKHELVTTCMIFVYVLGYSISLGPLLMLYAVEALLSIQMILKIYWGLMIVFTLTTDLLIEEVSVTIMFGVFFGFSLISFLFFRKKMVETKDVPKK